MVDVKADYISAIAAAGTAGTLIVSVGHGAGAEGRLFDNEGSCELAPNGAFTITGANDVKKGPNRVNVFYDHHFNPPPNPSQLEHDLQNNPRSPQLKNWRVYEELSKAFRAAKLRKVVLLTCNVGKSSEFLRKVANDWGTIIEAYKEKLQCTPLPLPGARGKGPTTAFFLHLNSEKVPYTTAEANVIAQEEIPFRPERTLRVGPPR